MYVFLTVNPFEMVTDLFKASSGSGVLTLMGLTSGLAFVCVLWQVIQLMIHSSDEKEVSRRKSYIIKILIAYAILIVIIGLINMARRLNISQGSGGSTGNIGNKGSSLYEITMD